MTKKQRKRLKLESEQLNNRFNPLRGRKYYLDGPYLYPGDSGYDEAPLADAVWTPYEAKIGKSLFHEPWKPSSPI